MSQMSEELKAALGISSETPDSLPNGEGVDTGEFEEYVDEPRPPVVFEIKEIATTVPDLAQSDAKVDYVHARNHTYTLLDMTTQALARALEVAKETEHPRAFESFNSLAATARSLTQDLLGLQKVFKDITKGRQELEPPPPTTNVQVNGDVNVNTPKTGTADLLSMLNDAIARGEIAPLVSVGGQPQEAKDVTNGDN